MALSIDSAAPAELLARLRAGRRRRLRDLGASAHVRWPEPVERVSAVLRAAAVEARIEEFPARHADGAGRCRGGRLRARPDREVARLRLRRRLRARARARRPARRRAGDRGRRRRDEIRVAAPDEVVHATGFEPGAVAPFPQRAVTPTLIDDASSATTSSGSAPARPPHGGAAAGRVARLARARPDRPGTARVSCKARSRQPERRRAAVQETEKIWMNGELVDWADAKIHVGVHGLHYGSGVFEGIRCYDDAEGPGGLPARATTCSACTTRRGSSTWRSRTRSTSCAGRLQRADRRQRPARVLPPPDRVLRLRRARRRDARATRSRP